ncbi:MAG: cache domain-containing protein [Limnobacter sp.]|nr:cache domain-containing protein [Limnobacter sp.]
MRTFQTRLFTPATWSVRTKLALTASVPLLFLIPFVAILLYAAGESVYSKVLVSKVRSDLTIALQVFERLQQSKLEMVSGWAESARLRNQLDANQGRLNPDLLATQAQSMQLSYLRLIDLDGTVRSSFPLHTQALRLTQEQMEIIRSRERKAQVILMQPDELSAISDQLQEQAAQSILATSNATPDGRSQEARGLVVQVVTPLFLNGQQLGWLEGGVLLNKNFGLVDNLSNLIYPNNALLEGSEGSATIFLEDVRISTTVELNENRRALGTRVSDVVRESVMGRGEVWLERAFVVNRWYWAGYAPISAPSGSRIGMLYVGFLEQPYADLKTQLLVLFVVAVLGAMLLGGLFVNKLAKVIFRPLGKMNAVMTRQEAGDNQARVGAMKRQDEFSELAAHFDELLDQLQARQAELETINAQLDARVSQRTAALHEANEKLRKAIDQLLASEKLALMGQLTAGVAHEFNNPLAIMMGHLDLLRMELGQTEGVHTLKLLDAQVQRMQRIVQKLLQFCRPEGDVNPDGQVDPEQIISDSLLFVQSDLVQCKAKVIREQRSTCKVQISATALQQILVNLLINASHALEAFHAQPFEGWVPTIRIRCTDEKTPEGRQAVCIRVENNGAAIDPTRQQEIFRMFFTTKREGKGSGVGLSVSKMLIQRCGGSLLVDSPVADKPFVHGVAFEVWVLQKAKPTSEILEKSIEVQ